MSKSRLLHVYGEYYNIKEFLTLQGYTELQKEKASEYICVSVFIGKAAKTFWKSDANFIRHEINVALNGNLNPQAVDLGELEEIVENLSTGELLKKYYDSCGLLPYATRLVLNNRVVEYLGEMKMIRNRGIEIDVSRN